MNQNANILLCAILADEVHTWSRASRSALEFEASAHYDWNIKIWSKNNKAFFHSKYCKKVLYMSFDSWQGYYKSVFFFNFTKLQFLNDAIYSYTKKNYLALGNLILSFKNLQDWKVNIFFSFSGER